MPVRIATEGERMQALGATLSRYLTKISGASFDVKSGGNDGIVLEGDAKKLKTDPQVKEAYLGGA